MKRTRITSEIAKSVLEKCKTINGHRCPHCGNVNTLPKEEGFFCKDCTKRYTATTGTPLANLRDAEKFIAFLSNLVSNPHPYIVGEQMGVNEDTIHSWVVRIEKYA